MITPDTEIRLREALGDALDSLFEAGTLTGPRLGVTLQEPRHEGHGDFACAVALSLARTARKNPRQIATELQKALGDANGLLEKAEIAGPGFLNLFVKAEAFHQDLVSLIKSGDDYLRSNEGRGKRVLVEFVSANPTGPLHVAHGRGAVIGDVVANLLEATGHDVTREYYINDQGAQTEHLARSIYIRYGQSFGRELSPPSDFYPGDYVIDIAANLRETDGDRFLDAGESVWFEEFRRRGIAELTARIKSDCAAFGIIFGHWQSEIALTCAVLADGRDALPALLDDLKSGGFIDERDGKLWFRTTDFGDDKDRVVKRDDGRTTYFASDIAYHRDKLARGFDRLINVWGADHGGYIARVKAGIAALGHNPDVLDIILVQMVTLSRSGEPVRMGKRLGTAIWLREVIDEVGADAVRYSFAMRRSDAQLDFDLDLAKRQSMDNPLYYAQMGHARICSMASRAAELGYDVDAIAVTPETVEALRLPEEIALIKTLLQAPGVVSDAARTSSPHLLPHYIQRLIAQFHGYYTRYKGDERVVSDDRQKTHARLLLCRALQTTLAGMLAIIGVDAPERMYLSESKNETEIKES